MNCIWLLLILALSDQNRNSCSSQGNRNRCCSCSNNNSSQSCNSCSNKKPEKPSVCETVCEAACEAAKDAAREENENCGCRRGFPINAFPVLDQ